MKISTFQQVWFVNPTKLHRKNPKVPGEKIPMFGKIDVEKKSQIEKIRVEKIPSSRKNPN